MSEFYDQDNDTSTLFFNDLLDESEQVQIYKFTIALTNIDIKRDEYTYTHENG